MAVENRPRAFLRGQMLPSESRESSSGWQYLWQPAVWKGTELEHSQPRELNKGTNFPVILLKEDQNPVSCTGCFDGNLRETPQ